MSAVRVGVLNGSSSFSVEWGTRMGKDTVVWAALGSVAGLALSVASLGTALAQDAVAPSPELAARMGKEKEARRACKIEICKAFSTPAGGAPITCDVTKTWLKDEITGRVTGGSYVWGYGHTQCSVQLKLDRAEIAKRAAGGKATFPEHTLSCNVEDKDPAKGKAFSVNLSITPVVSFDGGKATGVALDPVKTEGSSVASAAVTSLMAVDKVSGIVSKGMASEINAFLFNKCKEDGVEIASPK